MISESDEIGDAPLELTRLVHACSAESKTVPARGKALINTELSIAVPEGTYGRIAPRSGLGELESSAASVRHVICTVH